MTLCQVKPEVWAAALIVGAVQDEDARGGRGRGQHRGRYQLEVNVMGAVGELIVHGLIRQGALDLPDDPSAWTPSSRGADLPASGLDVKTVPLEPRKRYWCINARAADRGHRTGTIRGYLGVAVALWGSLAAVTDVVPSAHLHAPPWSCFALGSQPSYNLQRHRHLWRYGVPPRAMGAAERAAGSEVAVIESLDRAAGHLLDLYPEALDRVAVRSAVQRIEAHAAGGDWREASSLGLR